MVETAFGPRAEKRCALAARHVKTWYSVRTLWSQNVEEWLDENARHAFSSNVFENPGVKSTFFFEDEADAVLFKLFWG